MKKCSNGQYKPIVILRGYIFVYETNVTKDK